MVYRTKNSSTGADLQRYQQRLNGSGNSDQQKILREVRKTETAAKNNGWSLGTLHFVNALNSIQGMIGG